MTEAHAAIASLHHAWAGAVARSDVDAIVELLTPDYEPWAPGAEPVRGREAVRVLVGGLCTRDGAAGTVKARSGQRSRGRSAEPGLSAASPRPPWPAR